MIVRRRGMSRAVAAVVLAFTTALTGLIALSGSPRVHAAWQGGGALPGLGSGRIWKVAIDPASPALVLAATDAGVYRSVDSGQHWAQTGLTNRKVWSVGFDLRAPNAAVAALNGGGVQRSSDGGITWTDASAGLPSMTVRTLTFGLNLIAAGTSNGVAVSSDGVTWQPLGLTGYDVTAMAVSGYLPQITLIAGVDNVPANGTGYLFRNAGLTTHWDTLNMGPTSAVVSAVAASTLPPAPAVRVLLVCTNTGVYRSNDGGTVWQRTYPASSDLGTATLTTVTFSPLDPNLAYAGNDAGGNAGGALLRTTDAGLTFAPADAGLPADRQAASLAVAPTAPPLVVAAVNPSTKTAAIYVQTDSSVPAPGPTGAPEVVTSALPTVTAAPSLAPTPPPTVTPPALSGGESLPRRFFNWPLPLAVELLTVLAAIYVYMRWRQRRLHIEGPP